MAKHLLPTAIHSHTERSLHYQRTWQPLGQVTNAVFGFTSMLLNLVKDQNPDGVVVAFDRPEPTFRHEMLPEYKAQRSRSDLLIERSR